MSWRRQTVALVLSAVAAVAVVTLPVTGSHPPDVARAADTSQFRAGNIITDQLFFDGNAMSAASVQSFLNVRNPDCVAGAMPCLKNYRQSTSTRTATAKCPSTYTGATSETAATIIARVGQACGISQRVLLVILQKEEGLVTASGSSLTATRYRSAMGFGCPDTAACDSQYYGFFNQVYSAAAQYKKYAANPTYYSHRAGMNNSILFNPNTACGSSSVYIANQATAGLYNYTPYQPNAAALAAGAGSGNSCSAYGNRNFWIYFTNWFGSTQTVGAGALVDLYVSTGGASGYVGSVTSAVTCGLIQGGCSQGYSGGAIYWSPTTGARVVRTGAIKDLWASTGAEHGPLGYPTSSTGATADHVGQYQHFQNGSIFWSTAGARVVSGPIRTLWAAGRYEQGPLGYPISSTGLTADGVGQYQHFQRGSIFWSPTTGARVVSGQVRTLWAAAGYERGPLGYPTTSTAVTGDGAGEYQHFQKGSIFSTPGTCTCVVSGPVQALWAAAGYERGPLGYPMTSTAPTAGGAGSFSVFQRGRIYWSAATGAHSLSGPIADRWMSEGAEQSALGYPTTSVVTGADGAGQYQHFQKGSISSVPGSPARELTGPIRDRWVAAGADRALGYPTSDETTTGDGVGRSVSFQKGSIFSSPTVGAHAVLSGPIQALWSAAGNEHGSLGYPTSDTGSTADGVGQYQHFQKGSVFSSPGTGTRVVSGAVLTLWASTGYERGRLGYPTSSTGSTADGVGQYQHFQKGSVFSSPGTGTRVVSGAVLALWASTGYERGRLGYPTSSTGPTGDGLGQYQHFQKGSVFWSRTTGAHSVLGAFLTAWARGGYERGPLGYPTSEAYAVTGGSRLNFQHGSITVSGTTGKVTVAVR